MRNKPLRTAMFIAVVLIAMSLLLIHPSASLIVGASAGQDPNATLPPPKKTPPKRTTPPKTPPPRRHTPARTSTGRTSNTQPDNATAVEIAFWNSIKDSANADDFRAYLRKFPDGQFVEIAQNRINSLGAAKRNETPPATSVAAATSTSRRAGAIVRNQMGMEMAYIPVGTFMMGSSEAEAQAAYEDAKRYFPNDAKLEWFSNEKPQHQVTIREGFYMGRYEVTQAQWQAVMGSNPSNFKDCDQCPVEQVSWNDAQEFIRRMNARGDGFQYRLPTEAEWEYACRAGTTTEFAFGNSLSSEQANFNGNYPFGGAAKGISRQKTMTVGSFQPNGWGLYDMHGNVWEWCEDIWHDSYNGAPSDGSTWMSGGDSSLRALRGGSWGFNAHDLRAAFRGRVAPGFHDVNLGFRVVASSRS